MPERFAALTAAEEAGLLTSTVALPEDLKLGEGAGGTLVGVDETFLVVVMYMIQKHTRWRVVHVFAYWFAVLRLLLVHSKTFVGFCG